MANTARHMAPKKSNIARNAGIAVVAGAALAGSIAPANAFGVANTVAPVDYSATLTTYTTPEVSYENITTWGATVESTPAPAVEAAPAPAPVAAPAPAPVAAPAPAPAPRLAVQSSTTNVAGVRAQVLASAYDGIGGAYIWGGRSYKAWDCSGFVSNVYARAGINLTPYTYAMVGQLVPTAYPQPGDIVFTNGFAHVGIYVGNGQMISALNPSQGTQLTAVDGGGLMPVSGYYTYAGL
ncbi:C40 family peptidase [Rothia sp. P6271]|uniref:C40 family peptidase n=1 Tax=Rothia sp. P6271 TaxID=3402659 RepID=UPI003AC9142C